MLSPEMTARLNDQLNLELYSANLYLQMSAWCNDKGLDGAAAFLKGQSREEMDHMQRLFDYLSDTGAMPAIGSIASPPTEFNSLEEVLQLTYQHEQLITEKINALAHSAMQCRDYSTFSFLQWYVSEQHEEEKLFRSVLDKLALLNQNSNGPFFIDNYLKELASRPPSR